MDEWILNEMGGWIHESEEGRPDVDGWIDGPKLARWMKIDISFISPTVTVYITHPTQQPRVMNSNADTAKRFITLPALQADLVPDGLADALSSLCRHSLRHSDGCQPPGLRTEDSTGISLLAAVIQQELWNLGNACTNRLLIFHEPFNQMTQYEWLYLIQYSHSCTHVPYLGGFSWTCFTHNQHHLVLLDGRHNLLLPLVDGQRSPETLQLRRASPLRHLRDAVIQPPTSPILVSSITCEKDLALMFKVWYIFPLFFPIFFYNYVSIYLLVFLNYLKYFFHIIIYFHKCIFFVIHLFTFWWFVFIFVSFHAIISLISTWHKMLDQSWRKELQKIPILSLGSAGRFTNTY